MEISRADIMLKYVETYYRGSKFYTAQNNAKGKEFDIIHSIMEDLPNQFNPQTATWGLRFWEELLNIDSIGSMEERRIKILSKMATLQYITPFSLERLIKKIFNIEAIITRNVAPYTFLTEFDYKDEHLNIKAIRQLIEEYKEAHMAYSLLGYYNTKLITDIKIVNSLELKNELYPRANIPYLKYNGTARYDGSVRYSKYKSSERIELYPIKLNIKSEVKPRIIFLPKIQMKSIFQVPIKVEHKISCQKKFAIDEKIETKISIKQENVVLPRYEIKLKIGKHPNKYDGTARYDGKSRYYVEKEEIL